MRAATGGWSARTIDAAIAAVLVPLDMGALAQGWDPVVPVLAAASSVPLYWRRRQPVAVFAAVCAAFVVQLALESRPTAFTPALLVATYTVGCHAPRRSAVVYLAAGYLLCVLAVVRWSAGQFPLDVLPEAALGAAAWILGDNIRTRRAYLAALEDRALRLEAERDAQARIGAAEERARIAREMHDVIAHNLAVMIAQADGAAYAIEPDPARARSAMETVASTGRSALAEMRRLVGVLRSADSDPGLGPQPGLGEVAGLIQRLRHAGLAVEFDMSAHVEQIPPGLSLTAFRVVQESLTNVLKHAGPGAAVRVGIHQRPDGVAISVHNDTVAGPSPVPAPSGGNGIAGMRERAALYGGEITVGPARQGGWQVQAWLPIGAPA